MARKPKSPYQPGTQWRLRWNVNTPAGWLLTEDLVSVICLGQYDQARVKCETPRGELWLNTDDLLPALDPKG